MKCPYCDGPLVITKPPKRAANHSAYQFDVQAITATVDEPPPAQAAQLAPGETRERNRYQNQTLADVQVKLIRTAVYSVAVPLASIVPTILVDGLPWYTPIVALPITGLVAWSIIDKRGFRPKVFAEKLTRIDLDGDGYIGDEPLPDRVLVTVAVDVDTSRRYLNDIPVTPQLKRYLSAFLDSRVTFAEKPAQAYDVDVGDFRRLRDELLDRGMLRWKNENNRRSGYHWSPVAKRALAELRDIPLPDVA